MSISVAYLTGANVDRNYDPAVFEYLSRTFISNSIKIYAEALAVSVGAIAGVTCPHP